MMEFFSWNSQIILKISKMRNFVCMQKTSNIHTKPQRVPKKMEFISESSSLKEESTSSQLIWKAKESSPKKYKMNGNTLPQQSLSVKS